MIPEEVQNLICDLKSSYGVNHNLPQPYHTIFSILYTVISLVAFICNSLLLFTLYIHNKNKNRIHRSLGSVTECVIQLDRRRRSTIPEKTRDHLIGYLAMFDLLRSLTIPLTAVDVLTNYWPFGPHTEFIAQLTRAVPTALVFSSSTIITLIAINCYRQINNTSERQLTPRVIRCILIPVITISVIISTPIFYFTRLDPVIHNEFKNMGIDLNKISNSKELDTRSDTLQEISHGSATTPALAISTITNDMDLITCKEYNGINLSLISFVVDDWTVANDWLPMSRLCYSIFSLFTQLIIPFIIQLSSNQRIL